MAATFSVAVLAELTGLGKDISYPDKGTDGTTPTASTGIVYRTLATANTAEALDLGGVGTVTCLIIRAIDYDLDIDLDYLTAFNADLTVNAGEIAAVIPNPVLVYVNGAETDETPAYEYMVIGTT